MKLKRAIVILFILSFLTSLSVWLMPDRVKAMNINAMLTVEVNIALPNPNAAGEIRLHFSNRFDYVVLYRATSTNFRLVKSGSGDSPFVSQPDNWDNLYLALSKGLRHADIVYIYIKCTALSMTTNDTTLTKFRREFEFVNWSRNRGRRTLATDKNENRMLIDLTSEIKYSRRRKVAEVMGVSRLNKRSVDNHFESLPKIIKSAVNDIGQSGLLKYAGYSGTIDKINEGGCDEFCGWHYIRTNFDDAFHVLCVGCCDHAEGKNNYTPGDCCPGRNECLEARCFSIDESSGPPNYVCTENVFPHHGFKQQGRVAKITWELQNGKRTRIDKILKINDKTGKAAYSTWETLPIEYQPKVGDLLFRHKRCSDDNGGSHLMILLSDLSDPATHQVIDSKLKNIMIMQGSYFVEAAPEMTPDINKMCSDGEFWYDYYVVEMQ